MTPSPAWFRVVEYCGLAVSLVGGGALALSVALDLATSAAAAIALGAGLLGYFAADLVTGLVHWAGDRLGSPATPVLGTAVIAPFRDHHADPKDLTRRGFVELCGGSFFLVAGLWIPAWGWLGDVDGPASLALRVFLLSLGMWTGITNQLHCWAHLDAPPRSVAWLQRVGLILPPARHALHHAPPYEGHYCVTTGWCNALLARVGFFERLERSLGVSALRG